MKKYFYKILIKKLSGIVLIPTLVFINAVAAQMPVTSVFHEANVTLKYLGSDTESYVFNVVYNNEAVEKFLLRITDAEGNTLFTGIYSDKKFDKRFKLFKQGSDRKINFVVKNLKNNSVQVFEVTTISQATEDVVIKKIM